MFEIVKPIVAPIDEIVHENSRYFFGGGIGRVVYLVTYQRSEEHTSELQSRQYLVCRLLLEKKQKNELGDCDLLFDYVQSSLHFAVHAPAAYLPDPSVRFFTASEPFTSLLATLSYAVFYLML